jgi:thiosulfate/3-mercaptopyruvate sulfurtransferase
MGAGWSSQGCFASRSRRREAGRPWYKGRVSAPVDTAPKLQAYAHPGRLVTTDWLAAHLDDPSVVIAESDEDVLLYETGHIPGAVKIDWHTDLNDPVVRDYIDADGFARLMSEKGVSRDATLVFYGDNFNWWAAYALWVASLFGHPDARLLDGGRQKWIEEGRELTRDVPKPEATQYPRVERDDSHIRAFRDQVLAHARAGGRLVDVRSPGEYSGELLHMPDYPQEGALRGGHIPGAANVPWKTAANDDGTFKSREELSEIYLENLGLDADEEVVAYCRIGERSSHTWFVLTHLLGLEHVRNYDGSWVEWGNAVSVPIERPGLPVRPPL